MNAWLRKPKNFIELARGFQHSKSPLPDQAENDYFAFPWLATAFIAAAIAS